MRGQNVRPVDAQAPARLAARKTHIGRAELAQHIRHRQRRGGGELKLLRLSRRSGRHGTGRGCRVRCRLNLHRLSFGAGDDPSHRPPREGARDRRPARRSPRSRRSSRRSGRRPRDPVPSSPTRNPSFSNSPGVASSILAARLVPESRSTASTSVRRSRTRLRAYRPATQPRCPQRRERNGRIRVDHGLDAVHRPLSFGDGDSAVPPTRGRVRRLTRAVTGHSPARAMLTPGAYRRATLSRARPPGGSAAPRARPSTGKASTERADRAPVARRSRGAPGPLQHRRCPRQRADRDHSKASQLHSPMGFGSAERRRSRTDRAVGYTAALVLKTSWATGPVPLRALQ